LAFTHIPPILLPNKVAAKDVYLCSLKDYHIYKDMPPKTFGFSEAGYFLKAVCCFIDMGT